MGPFTGKLGPAVGYLWKGRPCVRSYREHINFPNTEGQLQQRSWFLGMVRFASKATEALKMGLWMKAREKQMTEGNYFVQKNKRFFKMEDGQLTVDYRQLTIAEGPAADVYFHTPQFEEDEVMVVDFEKNSMSLRSSNDDQVHLFVYAPAIDESFLSAPVARRSKSVRVKLPAHWSGQEVHIYGFVTDRDQRPSKSTYIGVGRVNHYEDRSHYIPQNKNWRDFVDIATEANATEPARPETINDLTAEIPVIDLFKDPPKVP